MRGIARTWARASAVSVALIAAKTKLRMSVQAAMMELVSLRHLLPERPCVLAGGGRAWEGGEGRVQAERPTRTRSQGQGNGPEGERHTELDRSPCPGRRCPCGCPQQVDRLGHPLARGVARMRPGWLATIMAGPAHPCPQPDDTHQEYPRRKSGDMDPPAGTLRSSAAPSADRVALGLIRAISGGRM